MRAKKTVLVAFLCIAASFFALDAQDLKVAYRVKVKAMMMSMNGTIVEYHSARYKLTKNDTGDLGEADYLIDYGDFATYAIDHKKKVVGKTTLEDKLKIAELNAKLEEGSETLQKMKKLLGTKDANLTVKKVGREQVAGRDCEKWEIALGKLSAKISVDPSLAPPAHPDALEKHKRSEGDDPLSKFTDATRSLKGFELKSEMVMPIGPITARAYREVTEVAVGPIPASVFELPKDYRQEDAGKKALADLQEKLNEKSKKSKK